MRWRSIGRRLNTVFIALVSAALAVFGCLSFIDNRDRLQSRLASNLQNVEERLTISLADPLWHLDRDAVQQIIEAETKSPIVRIAVREAGKNLIYALANSEETPEPPQEQIVRTFTVKFTEHGQVQNIADVEIVASRAGVVSELRRLVIRRIIGIALLISLLALALSYTVYSLLLRPMKVLQKALEGAAQEGGEQTLAKLAAARNDELGNLVHGFNKIAQRLSKDLARRIDAEKQSRSAYEQQRVLVEALEESMNEAKEASRAKSSFLANMSHEIRTPMNAILGLSHLVRQSDLDAKQSQYVEKIQQAGRHLLSIINDILDFSKIEAGKLKIEEANLDLDQVLENVSVLISEKAQAKGLELIFDVASDVPRQLIGDSLRLGQILINYANNAVKFTSRGEIAIVVRVEERTADKAILRFSVRDTGIGLSKEQIARLFQSFEQADTSTTRQFGGTGLGLAICKRLAALMRGTVGVSSEPGAGSVFWFTAELGVRCLSPVKINPSNEFHGRRLMIVDDNVSALSVMRNMLESLNFGVATSSSGREALHLLESADATGSAIDLVLLDWQMPSMDGIETAREIRKLSLRHQPRLVMTTWYGREEAMIPAQSAGIEQVLQKPISQSVLFDCVATALGAHARPCGESTSVEAQPIPSERLRGRRVLLVEDSEINQEVAKGLLSSFGVQVDLASTGLEALAKVRAASYEVVFMDMQMPVMDGITAAIEMRKIASLAGMPIIAMTANVRAEDRERCLRAGMVDFVAKPIDPADLLRALQRWVGASAISTTAMAAHTERQSPGQPVLEIPGLHVAQGLSRVLGRKDLYISLLRKFSRNYREEAVDKIRAAVARGDFSDAERMAHSLKGVAGNIGANVVFDAASRLEYVLRHDRQNLNEELASTRQAILPLISALDQYFSEQALAGNEVAVPSESTQASMEATEAFNQLKQLVANDDPFASNWIIDKKSLLAKALGGRYDALKQALDDFDFDTAEHILKSTA